MEKIFKNSSPWFHVHEYYFHCWHQIWAKKAGFIFCIYGTKLSFVKMEIKYFVDVLYLHQMILFTILK